MLKLSDIIPEKVLKLLDERGFKLDGPWAEYYQQKGNIFKVRELPLRVEFVGSDTTILKELEKHATQVIHGKNRTALKVSRRHWLVIKFTQKQKHQTPRTKTK
ncbi:MAG: hypothetical protein ACTSSA_10845 [Candidatus Freyarchaeota archaeon]